MHQFIKVSEISKGRPDSLPSMHGIAGAEVVCALCGQVRRVWSDGRIQVVYESGSDVKDPLNACPSSKT